MIVLSGSPIFTAHSFSHAFETGIMDAQSFALFCHFANDKSVKGRKYED
jgi:hypothetical protein